MRPVGSSVVLRAVAWQGELPKAGDWLRTRTGRTYEIERVRGTELPLRLDCVERSTIGLGMFDGGTHGVEP